MDQFYVFTMPDTECPVWAEVFLADGSHLVAPTPHWTVSSAVEALIALNRGAMVDVLDSPEDLAEVRGWARSCPLELIAA